MKSLLVTFLVISSFMTCLGQTPPNGPEVTDPEWNAYDIETVVEGFNIPWGMAVLSDGSMLITEKSGELIHFKNGQKTQIEGLPEISAKGQGGLLDVVLHPDFKNNKLVYIAYASSRGDGKGSHTAIGRGKLEGSKLVNFERLYKASPNSEAGQHFGSRIAFDKEGYLYFSIGERGAKFENPQDITRDGGKVYRLYDDGRVPEDNPFYNEPGAKKAIYSYGHRNPQGMLLHPKTGQIWVNEHGPKGGDEINIVKKGANYGWPEITYGINYDGTILSENTAKPGMEQPFYYWVPSIAPSGFAYVTNSKYPAWEGDLLVGSLKFSRLEKLTIKNNKVIKREKIIDGLGRVRNVVLGPDGIIYAGIDGKGIVKIVPKGK
ncbi:PQQ-dependent sugar dehydrogenase [Cyclobacterium sp. 1_MG-2023]|uniref:PQQ-dependent sugar dehydrogenase n=1 Tax=Cyclobacterium sp. 1_MG-2023 TaxID=3062681 RepID=UPI0026E1EDEA|nr:PQQ-dependent sugar dehydrogenase [Cyclobacterium sp. 1_MG-2023]MDO6436787.1 PQQ-dependent sugar dehydrogenase [Cyclobacterium sp. 1_MG-2023]